MCREPRLFFEYDARDLALGELQSESQAARPAPDDGDWNIAWMTSGNFDIESADHCRVVINEGLRDDDVAKTSAKYLEAYEKLMGKKLL